MSWVGILLWIHLGSLALGGAAAFGIPVVGSQMPSATDETRPLLFRIARRLSMLGRAAIAILLITGPLMLWLKYGWAAPNQTWFWIKMALVVVLLGVVIYAGINAARAEKGDRDAAMRAPTIGIAAIIVYLAVIFAAVFSFG